MKIIKTGSTYQIYGEDLIVLDKLPAQTYKIGFSKFTGFFLEKQHDLEIKEDKIYGVHEEKANKVLNRFEKSRKNLGVILSGDKVLESLCSQDYFHKKQLKMVFQLYWSMILFPALMIS